VPGIPPWTAPLQLWEAKTRIGAGGVPATGVRREGAVAEMVVDEPQAREHAVEIVPGNVRYKDAEHGFMAAEIDFEVRLDGDEEVINVELKTVYPIHLHQWTYVLQPVSRCRRGRPPKPRLKLCRHHGFHGACRRNRGTVKVHRATQQAGLTTPLSPRPLFPSRAASAAVLFLPGRAARCHSSRWH
jgi:hypothetical protein